MSNRGGRCPIWLHQQACDGVPAVDGEGGAADGELCGGKVDGGTPCGGHNRALVWGNGLGGGDEHRLRERKRGGIGDQGAAQGGVDVTHGVPSEGGGWERGRGRGMCYRKEGKGEAGGEGVIEFA